MQYARSGYPNEKSKPMGPEIINIPTAIFDNRRKREDYGKQEKA